MTNNPLSADFILEIQEWNKNYVRVFEVVESEFWSYCRAKITDINDTAQVIREVDAALKEFDQIMADICLKEDTFMSDLYFFTDESDIRLILNKVKGL